MATKLALSCPRCQAALRAQTFGTVTIDLCDTCGGHWYDAGELAQIREMPPTERPHTPPEACGPRWVDSKSREVLCPRCRVALATERFGYTSDLVLDRCGICNGMWVDAGELDRMDELIAEWSRDLEHDRAKWADKLATVEATIGHKLDSAERPGRLGALIGMILDKVRSQK